MSELIDVLNLISQENQKAQKPADIAFGTVMSVSPLSIQIDNSAQAIPSSAFVLTSGVVAKTASVQGEGGGTVIINEGLSVGDRVVMLRVSKGNRFIILSKTQ